MRRHESLQSLSRRHHGALQLARALQVGVAPRLRATLPADPGALVDEVLARWREELEPHFAVEEEVLAPAIEGRSPELTRLAIELRAQHDELRAMLGRLETDAADPIPLLDAFGRRLEHHVRWEERTLFEAVQRLLDADALVELGAPMSIADVI